MGVQPPYVLTVGTIEPRKNHVRLIKAFEVVASAFPALKLVIAGKSGWLNGEVFKTAKESSVGSRILFLNYVSDADLPELYRLAEVMAYPSLYEGFGLPALEALACGTPVLTSNNSSLPEVVGEAALLVDPMSVSEIAAGLTAAIENPELRSRMRALGFIQARRFSWDRAARETLRVYEAAVCSRSVLPLLER